MTSASARPCQLSAPSSPRFSKRRMASFWCCGTGGLEAHAPASRQTAAAMASRPRCLQYTRLQRQELLEIFVVLQGSELGLVFDFLLFGLEAFFQGLAQVLQRQVGTAL